MEELQKSFVKALLNALIRLEFYEDSELTIQDIVDQADGRSNLQRSDLEKLTKKYISTLREISSENPSETAEFLSSRGFFSSEIIAFEETWTEEKGIILRKHLDKREIEWCVKGEPSWSIDIHTIGKNTESITLPVANFKFELSKQEKEKTLQFSVEKNGLVSLLTSLEQANLYLSSNLSS